MTDLEIEREMLLGDTLRRIEQLKALLKESDYKAIKYAEGLISDEDYILIKATRQNYRDEINTLQQNLI